MLTAEARVCEACGRAYGDGSSVSACPWCELDSIRERGQVAEQLKRAGIVLLIGLAVVLAVILSLTVWTECAAGSDYASGVT